MTPLSSVCSKRFSPAPIVGPPVSLGAACGRLRDHDCHYGHDRNDREDPPQHGVARQGTHCRLLHMLLLSPADFTIAPACYVRVFTTHVIRAVATSMPESSVIETEYVAIVRPRCSAVATAVTVPCLTAR